MGGVADPAFRLVATSASEWLLLHSLALVATFKTAHLGKRVSPSSREGGVSDPAHIPRD
jgi:hypothetical protein